MACSGTRRLSRSRQKKKRKGMGHSHKLNLRARRAMPGYSEKQVKIEDKSLMNFGMVFRLYRR